MSTRTSTEELHAALELLAAPPPEAFAADIGGAPQAPDPTQADAAQQWQHKALQLLQRVQELVHALAEHGALPALGGEAPSPQQSNVSVERFSQVSGTTFWKDITSVSSSQEGSHGTAALGGKSNSASGQTSVPSSAQNGHGGKRSLIEEIGTDEPSHRQIPEPSIRPGVIIEELGDDDDEEDAGEVKDLLLGTCRVLYRIVWAPLN